MNREDIKHRAVCALAGLCAVLIVGVTINCQRADKAQAQLRTGYENSLYNTLDGISSVYNDLSKASFCTDRDYLRKLYGDISARAGTASSRLGELPISQESVQKTEELLNHISDYCAFLAKQESEQKGERENICGLRDSCKRLYTALGDISAVLVSGQDVFAADILQQTDIAWQQAEADSVNYPTLIYDGPFSQSEEIGKPRQDREEISYEKARAKAEKLLGEGLDKEGENGGDIPCYVFRSGDKSAAVTKAGGMLLWYLDNSPQEGKSLSVIDAKSRAQSFLEDADYSGFEAVFVSQGGDSVIFNFAPVLDDAVIYPDLIKVRVSLKSGNITGFEGSSYVINNRERQITPPMITASQARTKVSGMLSIESSRLSVIPKGNSEALAWEFYCLYGDDEYVVYIDAVNGKQIQMYRIVNTDDGQMVM